MRVTIIVIIFRPIKRLYQITKQQLSVCLTDLIRSGYVTNAEYYTCRYEIIIFEFRITRTYIKYEVLNTSVPSAYSLLTT